MCFVSMAGLSAAGDAVGDGTGVLFMVLSEALLALVNAIVKFVKAWPQEQIMAVRYTMDLVLCLGLCCTIRPEIPGRKTTALLLLRGVAYCAFITFLWAGLRSCLPLGDNVVIVVAISPLFLVLLTRIFLGEEIPRGWPLQLALCVAGALLVNKPMVPDRTCPASAAALPFAAAFFGALMNFMSRNVKTVSPAIVMAHNDLVALVLTCGVMALSSGGTLPLPDSIDRNFCIVAVSAVIGWIGLMSNVKGYQSVSVAAVASIAGYSAVPLGYLMQVLLFGELPDAMSAAGATLIFCTNVGMGVSKYRAAKKAKSMSMDEAEQDAQSYRPLPTGEAQEEALGA